MTKGAEFWQDLAALRRMVPYIVRYRLENEIGDYLRTPRELAEIYGINPNQLVQYRYIGSGPRWIKTRAGAVFYPLEPFIQWWLSRLSRFPRATGIHEWLAMSDLLTERQAAHFLGINLTTLQKWRRAGRVPAIPLTARFNLGGPMHAYRRADLAAMLPIKRYRGRGIGTRLICANEPVPFTNLTRV